MSFLGIPSFEEIGRDIESNYIKPSEEWRSMVASFPAELRKRYYETLATEGVKSGITSFFGVMDQKEAVVYFFSDERDLACDICSHVLQQKIGLSSATADSLSHQLIGSESQFGEMISDALNGKSPEVMAQKSLTKMVETAEFDSKMMHYKIQEIKNEKVKPFVDDGDSVWDTLDDDRPEDMMLDWEERNKRRKERHEERRKNREEKWYKEQEENRQWDIDWTRSVWGRSERDMEQAIKEIGQKKPGIITGLISGEISKNIPGLNAQENKCLTEVLFTAVTAENPKDFGEKMSKLMKQGQNSQIIQGIARKQFGASIGDLSAVSPEQWKQHAEWVIKVAGVRDFAQLRRHAFLQPEALVGSFIGEMEKNPELVAKTAKHLAPELLASVDTKFLTGLIGTITSSRTSEECVGRMSDFLSNPQNMEQMTKLLQSVAGDNASYLKELTPKDWMGIVSSLSQKYDSFDKLKGACVFKHEAVLSDFIGKVETAVIGKQVSKNLESGVEYLQNGAKKLGAFFGIGQSR